MTKHAPSIYSLSRSSTLNTDPPSYESSYDMTLVDSEKPSMIALPCDVHGVSPTPHLDAALQTPSAQTLLLALSKAFADAANSEECTKCAAESASKALSSFARDMKAAKKNSEWSKEDKKAIKKELKDTFKPLKGEMRGAWKGRWEQKQEA